MDIKNLIEVGNLIEVKSCSASLYILVLGYILKLALFPS
jgi:hypothetical protein